MLSLLFGDELIVKDAGEKAAPAAFAAIYVHEDQSPGAACLCSQEFAAFAGAALSMVPPNVAKDAARGGALTEMMAGNLYEVMNICSRLVISDTTTHLRLAKVCSSKEADGLTLIEQTGKRVEFEVSIPRYGAGNLAFIVT
jgi:hypothetical protein